MSMRVETHGDVVRLRMQSLGSRAVGLDVSAYILHGVMIDTGFHRARRSLVKAATEHGVHGVIVTHWHEDHAGNVGALAERGLPVTMRHDTEATLRARPSIRLYRRVVWGYAPPLASVLLAAAPSSIQCIHTPGHSTDHQVVWDAETGTLFSGDLWLGVRSKVLHATEDPYLIIQSLRAVQALGPGRMFDAHRGPVARPRDAIAAKIQWLGDTLQTIERRIAAGWSDRAIVRQVLGGEETAALVSGGDYARRNLVKAVRQHLVR
jgi:glyoxylase-like metal-dependent hydrolase (beta-lactamase superfamily II)